MSLWKNRANWESNRDQEIKKIPLKNQSAKLRNCNSNTHNNKLDNNQLRNACIPQKKNRETKQQII
jgi:hypothetical protein